jgi:hypothetical protein
MFFTGHNLARGILFPCRRRPVDSKLTFSSLFVSRRRPKLHSRALLRHVFEVSKESVTQRNEFKYDIAICYSKHQDFKQAGDLLVNTFFCEL